MDRVQCGSCEEAQPNEIISEASSSKDVWNRAISKALVAIADRSCKDDAYDAVYELLIWPDD